MSACLAADKVTYDFIIWLNKSVPACSIRNFFPVPARSSSGRNLKNWSWCTPNHQDDLGQRKYSFELPFVCVQIWQYRYTDLYLSRWTTVYTLRGRLRVNIFPYIISQSLFQFPQCFADWENNWPTGIE